MICCRTGIHFTLTIDAPDPVSLGIKNHATAELAVDRPAQINITIRKPNTKASPTDSLMATFISGLRPAGIGNPASLISFDRTSCRTAGGSEKLNQSAIEARTEGIHHHHPKHRNRKYPGDARYGIVDPGSRSHALLSQPNSSPPW